MLNNELLHSIDWKDYINDYEINKRYSSSGIKVQSKVKDINEINIEDLYHLDDPDYQYCMFDFDFDLRHTNKMISCLLNGKSFSYYYDKNDKNREICFDFNTESKVLTRHFKNLSGISVSDNITEYNLNDNYIIAIIKFLSQRNKEMQIRDSRNSKDNKKADPTPSTQQNNMNNEDKLKLALDDLKELFDNGLKLKIDMVTTPLTISGYDQIADELLSELRKGSIKSILLNYKKDYTENDFSTLSHNLWEYKQLKLTEYENKLNGTN